MGWLKDKLKETGRAINRGAINIGKAVKKGTKDAGRTAEKAVQDTGKTAKKALNDSGKTLERAAHDTGRALEKAVQDTGKTLEKALHDTGDEVGRAGRNVNRAAIAAGHFLENQTQAVGETLSDAEKRVRDGKLIDAIWHVTTDPLRHSEKNFAEAVSESRLLNNIATAAASIYGGPAGAAAYAAWFTYKQSGDLELALKAGVIAGATAQGLQMVNGMPTDTGGQLIKKTLASASIGGAAVAASGGGEEEIIEAFVKGAALTAAREHYKSLTNKEIEGRAPTQAAVPKGDPTIKHQFSVLQDANGKPILDAYGNVQIDIRSMPRDISHVGLATSNPSAPIFSGAETSPLMQIIAKLPYVNDMAYYHDQWGALARMQGIEVQATILPAMVLTVTGSDTPVIDQATKETVDNGNEP